MKFRKLSLFAAVLITMSSGACAQKKAGHGGEPALNSRMDSISYIFGASLGQNIRQSEIEDVNIDAVMSGVRNALESDSNLRITMQDGDRLVRQFMQEKQVKAAAEGKKKADDYMASLANDKNLKKTDSGIYYEVLKEGTGPKPSETDNVRVHYEGKTTAGETFDSSYERGQPAEFPLNRVIPGWTEIVQMMPVGSKWRVIIPPSLAYGERGSPPTIGPNEVLIFQIELLDILPATPK